MSGRERDVWMDSSSRYVHYIASIVICTKFNLTYCRGAKGEAELMFE